MFSTRNNSSGKRNGIERFSCLLLLMTVGIIHLRNTPNQTTPVVSAVTFVAGFDFVSSTEAPDTKEQQQQQQQQHQQQQQQQQQQSVEPLYFKEQLIRSKEEKVTSSTSVGVNDDVTDSIWPFSHHNHNNDGTNATDDATNDKVCYDATSCDKCNAYYTCHWCAHDSTCHAIGSVYGCMIGSTCPDQQKKKKQPPNIDPSDTSTGCTAHSTCRNCTLSSSLCHWCAHDNMCHAVGSIYGCISGVDCYDNPHCQRSIPEPIDLHHHHHHNNHKNSNEDGTADYDDLLHRNIGLLPIILIVSLSTILLCCSTSCCCVMNCLKGAYDDLAVVATIPSSQQSRLNHHHNNNENNTDESNTLLLCTETTSQPSSLAVLSQQPNVDDTFFDCNNNSNISTVAIDSSSVAAAETTTNVVNDEKQPLLETTTTTATTTATNDDYLRMMDGEENNVQPPSSSLTISPIVCHTTNNSLTNRMTTGTTGPPPPHQQQHRRFVAMHRLYMTCMGCYLCTVLLIGLFTYTAIHYFPQKPIYNICNDSVAWKSLMDSMTSFTATAEFQILASVYNPNPVDVALDMGKGSFSHNGDAVGTYEIPSTIIASEAITDLLIVARFTPEKWQALSITAEYYSGNLILHVNADVTIRIPSLLDYTISTSLQDVIVHVNALSDRRLCACPTWSNNNNNKNKTLSLHHSNPEINQ